MASAKSPKGVSMRLINCLLRKAAEADGWQPSGFELMPDFQCFAADSELSRLLTVSATAVVARGGALDPGFSMRLVQPVERMWFSLLVSFSVAGNREALRILADFAPTDSARLWAANPPSCKACGAVLPHHTENCSTNVFLADDDN